MPPAPAVNSPTHNRKSAVAAPGRNLSSATDPTSPHSSGGKRVAPSDSVARPSGVPAPVNDYAADVDRLSHRLANDLKDVKRRVGWLESPPVMQQLVVDHERQRRFLEDTLHNASKLEQFFNLVAKYGLKLCNGPSNYISR
ncbi:hypothetical protein DVH05_003301 [Phytophthora capsici]|nr:hypothetical protein DVH05_003301 [Phytophthora capsici]